MKIPHRIKINSKISYEVVWVDRFNDPSQVGECRFPERQIVIKKELSESDLIKTLIHELLHVVEYEAETPIPHKLVYMLEKWIYRLLKANKII